MANPEQPYDPYVPSNRGTPGANAHHDGGGDRTAALQAVRIGIIPKLYNDLEC